MKIKVNSPSKKCPFFAWIELAGRGFFSCGADNMRHYTGKSYMDLPILEVPLDCPLRTGPITIELDKE